MDGRTSKLGDGARAAEALAPSEELLIPHCEYKT